MKIDSNSAVNGVEGVKQVEQRHEQRLSMYRLILLDYSMPLMDGPQAATKIRDILQEVDQQSRPYICCVSSYQDQSFKDVAFASGMDEFITKPIPK